MQSSLITALLSVAAVCLIAAVCIGLYRQEYSTPFILEESFDGVRIADTKPYAETTSYAIWAGGPIQSIAIGFRPLNSNTIWVQLQRRDGTKIIRHFENIDEVNTWAELEDLGLRVTTTHPQLSK